MSRYKFDATLTYNKSEDTVEFTDIFTVATISYSNPFNDHIECTRKEYSGIRSRKEIENKENIYAAQYYQRVEDVALITVYQNTYTLDTNTFLTAAEYYTVAYHNGNYHGVEMVRHEGLYIPKRIFMILAKVHANITRIS